MDKKYDLTTKQGLSEALSGITDHPAYKLLTFNPTSFLVGKVYDLIKDAFDITPTIKEQRETAEAIIEVGKQNGVDSVEFTMEQEAGLSLKAKLGAENVDARIGKSGKMTIKVKYK
jgi:hypothetical protein